MRLLILILLAFLWTPLRAQDKDYYIRFNQLIRGIELGRIPKAKAEKELQEYLKNLPSSKLGVHKPWIFPLAGYDFHAIGGNAGEGYQEKGYSFLDGNKHKAHPADDIFILDRNQDNLDDRNLKPVQVRSILDGVVIAENDEWETVSKLRGGKYIVLYHPEARIFSYYAHNQKIFLKPGDWVKAGQEIAEVGRTGLNAYKKRSPTHLHFSSFRIVEGSLRPFNPYGELKNSWTNSLHP